MTLSRRLQQLELKIKLKTKQPGCYIELFIVMPEEMQKGYFDRDSYRPANGETENYLKHLKDSDQCRGCKGSCAIDWSTDGFVNHTIGGERISSSPGPNIFWMFCAAAEIPVLCRRLMNGGREPND
jgi:hypothetical protein